MAAYDAIAGWYDQSIRQGSLLAADDLLGPAVLACTGDIHGRAICDLACGQGNIARQLARQGAQVTGVDLSQKLLEIALQEEACEPLGIVYVHDDAQRLDSVADGQFEIVICNLALMDIPDLSATLTSVRRILRPEGWFVTSITHPCFQAPPNRSYFEEGFWRSDNPNGVRGQVGAYHRTLSSYLNAFTKAGFILERLEEPRLGDRELPPVLVIVSRSVEQK